MNGCAVGRCPEGQTRLNAHVVGYADRRSAKVAEGSVDARDQEANSIADDIQASR
jgi:hypothetical protein